MEDRDLRQLAQDKIVAESGKALDATGEAAAALLADLYIVGLAHGVTPQYWAWVTDLPTACWDVTRDVAARRRMAIEAAAPQPPHVGRGAERMTSSNVVELSVVPHPDSAAVGGAIA